MVIILPVNDGFLRRLFLRPLASLFLSFFLFFVCTGEENTRRLVGKGGGEPMYCMNQRRRLKTEEKATGGTAAWGAELIQFLAALAIWHQDKLKNRMNCIRAI